MGPPSIPPSFRPEDELEHLTKKMLYDMENPPADDYFGEWGRGTPEAPADGADGTPEAQTDGSQPGADGTPEAQAGTTPVSADGTQPETDGTDGEGSTGSDGDSGKFGNAAGEDDALFGSERAGTIVYPQSQSMQFCISATCTPHHHHHHTHSGSAYRQEIILK